MLRNLCRRVKVLYPTEDLIQNPRFHFLSGFTQDMFKTLELLLDGSYQRVVSTNEEPLVSSQEVMMVLEKGERVIVPDVFGSFEMV